jgi:hypothetical protein
MVCEIIINVLDSLLSYIQSESLTAYGYTVPKSKKTTMNNWWNMILMRYYCLTWQTLLCLPSNNVWNVAYARLNVDKQVIFLIVVAVLLHANRALLCAHGRTSYVFVSNDFCLLLTYFWQYTVIRLFVRKVVLICETNVLWRYELIILV